MKNNYYIKIKSEIGKEYPIEEKDIFEFLGLQYTSPENRQSGTILQKY